MAFNCAVEPCEVSEPVEQLIAGVVGAPDPPAGGGVVLLSVPQAASASVAVMAAPAMTPNRFSFTCCPFKSSGLTRGAPFQRHGPDVVHRMIHNVEVRGG